MVAEHRQRLGMQLLRCSGNVASIGSDFERRAGPILDESGTLFDVVTLAEPLGGIGRRQRGGSAKSHVKPPSGSRASADRG